MKIQFKLPALLKRLTKLVKHLTKVVSQQTHQEFRLGMTKMEGTIARVQRNQQVVLLRTDYLE